MEITNSQRQQNQKMFYRTESTMSNVEGTLGFWWKKTTTLIVGMVLKCCTHETIINSV